MEYFTPEQTFAVLAEIGVHVVTDTPVVWMGLCPFHGNLNTPAFAVNKENGKFICFNDACGAKGELIDLVRHVTKKNHFGAYRVLARAKKDTPPDITKIIQREMTPKDFPEFKQSTLDKMFEAFWNHKPAQEYMYGRKFTDDTLMHFRVGYSPKMNMVAVPMYDIKASPVGIIARSISDKRFKNSVDLPKSRTLWNIHRAKRHPHLVICEASFDAMRVWQATGLDAVATLGSSLGTEQVVQINKYFTHVTIFTDDDWENPTVVNNCTVCRKAGHGSCVGHNTGLKLGQQIADAAKGLVVTWAHLDSLKRYDGHKDAGDLTDGEIQYAIEHAVSNVEMSRMASV